MYDRKKDYLMRRADKNYSKRDYYSRMPLKNPIYDGYERTYKDGYSSHPELYRDYDHQLYYDNDYRKDYRGVKNAYGMDYDKEYHEDLKHWISTLQKKDRFKINMEQIIKRAKEMGVDFKEFDEEEFYAAYLMHLSDYPKISNDYNSYIEMTVAYFNDDDIAVSPSEKLCKYYYSIVLGEE